MTNQKGTPRCPCGGTSIGTFRGEFVCAECKRIELKFNPDKTAATVFRAPTLAEIAARIARYSSFDWENSKSDGAHFVDTTPVPAPPVPEGKILISGYAHYVL